MGSKPEREDETPSAGINWKMFLLVAGIIGVAFFAGMMMQGDGDSVSADVNSPSVDIGQGIEPNNPPAAVETETPDTAETGLSSDIKTVYISSNSDVSKMKPGILYIAPTTEGDDPETHSGFIIIEKDKLAGAIIPFYGTDVKIELTNGIYRDATGVNSKARISSWGVVYKLPWADSTGRPIPDRVRLVEFDRHEESFDGKYVMITIQN